MASTELTKRLKDLYKVQKTIKELNTDKVEIQRSVEDLIVDGGLENQKIEVGGDATFCYKMKRVVGGLSQKLLKDRLTEYFIKDGDGTEEDVEELYKFILEGRAVTEKFQLDTTWKKEK